MEKIKHRAPTNICIQMNYRSGEAFLPAGSGGSLPAILLKM